MFLVVTNHQKLLNQQPISYSNVIEQPKKVNSQFNCRAAILVWSLLPCNSNLRQFSHRIQRRLNRMTLSAKDLVPHDYIWLIFGLILLGFFFFVFFLLLSFSLCLTWLPSPGQQVCFIWQVPPLVCSMTNQNKDSWRAQLAEKKHFGSLG